MGRTQPEKDEDLRKFIRDYGDEGWVLVMDNWWLTGLYELRYVDSLFVIDSDGRIILRSDGPVPPSALSSALRQSLFLGCPCISLNIFWIAFRVSLYFDSRT
ncbi:MAG: hypothetical protein QXM16_08130 [Nitrososphaerota archaeon]